MVGSNYDKFYKLYIPALDSTKANDRGEVSVCCPFHSDRDPSFSINLFTGLWRCFGECQEGGDSYSFYQRTHGETFPNAKREVDKIMKDATGVGGVVVAPPVTPVAAELIERWHKLLLASPTICDFLYNERGYTKETVVRFKIGFDGGRITLPIYNESGLCMNIRRYLPKGKGQNKMINYKAGYGKARLYPIENLKEDIIILHEGEMDSILANQLGFNAMTTTGGAGTWLMGWTESFRGKIVYICYDIDAGGKEGAQKVAKALFGIAKKVFVVNLPLTEPKNADVTDYFIKHGYTVEDFKLLLQQTKLYAPPKRVSTSDDSDDEDIVSVSLYNARLAKYRGRKVKMRVLVVGKDLAPYTIPRKVKFNCTSATPENKDCTSCMINLSGGEAILELAPNPRLLNLIRCTDAQQQTCLRAWVGIPKCSSYKQEVIIPQNVEELLLAPELTYDSQSSGDTYTLQRAFYVAGDTGALRPNQSYEVEGVMAPDPWQQYVTFVLTSALPLQDSISGFIIDERVRNRLKQFQLKENETVKEKFDEIHDQFTHNVTHIYGRNDLLTALDLVYHSVLTFDFQGISVNKGWLECLIIGDTRTGKSESTERLMGFYKIGEMVFGENSSFAGLVGGMQQTQQRWFITWGKIPLNDKRLVIIDEASGLSEDDISRMSGIRSSGVAEITKIQTEKSLARTRLIWISNPRSGRALRTYAYGVEAIPELIGKAEDVSRFDFAISAASEEIPSEVINQAKSVNTVPLTYDAEVCRLLVIWAWSRKSEDIIFEDDAVLTILHYATEMGKFYSARIPLIEPANQRIKLARMAAATAARLYSTDDAGKQVIVKKIHVEFAHDYLNEIYAKPSLDYKSFSRQERDNESIAAKHHDAVLKFVTTFTDVAELFLRQAYVRSSDMEEQLDLDREAARGHIHFLSKTRMLDRSPHGYRKSPAFIMLLRQWKTDGGN